MPTFGALYFAILSVAYLPASGAECWRYPEPPQTARALDEAAGPRLELLDAGQEPRRSVAYRIAPGSHQIVTAGAELVTRLKFPDWRPIAAVMPPVDIVVEVETLPGDEHSRVLGKLTRVAPREEPSAFFDEQILEMFQSIVGLRAAMVLDGRGAAKEVSVTMPETLPPALRELFSGFDRMVSTAPQFPGEELGVGATWTVTTPIRIAGLRFERHSHYTLTSIEDDVLKLAVRWTLNAGEQLFGNDEPRITLAIMSITATGEGTTVLDLRRPAPLKAEMAARCALQIGGDDREDGELPLRYEADLRIEMEGRDRE